MSSRYIPGGQAPPRPVPRPPGQSYTPSPGEIIPRFGAGGAMGGRTNIDELKRKLAQLMADLAMAQAMGKSPRHLADLQGQVYKLQLEIQLAEESSNETASWLGDMVSASHQYATTDPRYGR